MKKLAIITTHPIQYQIPLFKNLKKYNIEPIVFYASRHGLKKTQDHEFLQKIKWDIDSDILGGYKSYFSKKQKYKINDFRLSFTNLEEILLKENIKFILIFGWNNFHYLKSIYLSYKNNIKLILRVETNLESTKNIFKIKLKDLFLKYLFKLFSKILFIGKLNKEFYLHHKVPLKKLMPAPYFVDNKFFKIKFSKDQIKKRLNIKNKKVVLFVGKLILRKNPIEFIRLAELYKNDKNIIFLMIGNGNLKTNCDSYIKSKKLKNIKILGFINQKKIREYYKASDLLIVPSYYETWGLNINEAFASDTPVICSDKCGAAKDLIDEGKTGFKYKLGDLKSLFRKTNNILKEKKIHNKFIKNLRLKIKKYNLEITLKSLKKIINEN